MAREITWKDALRSITARIRSTVRHKALEVTLEEMKRPGITPATSDALVRLRDKLIEAIDAEFPYDDEA